MRETTRKMCWFVFGRHGRPFECVKWAKLPSGKLIMDHGLYLTMKKYLHAFAKRLMLFFPTAGHISSFVSCGAEPPQLLRFVARFFLVIARGMAPIF